MAGITLAQAEAKLSTFMDAADALAVNKSYTMPGGVTVTRENLADIQNAIDFWDKKVKRLSRGGLRMSQVTPVRN